MYITIYSCNCSLLIASQRPTSCGQEDAIRIPNMCSTDDCYSFTTSIRLCLLAIASHCLYSIILHSDASAFTHVVYPHLTVYIFAAMLEQRLSGIRFWFLANANVEHWRLRYASPRCKRRIHHTVIISILYGIIKKKRSMCVGEWCLHTLNKISTLNEVNGPII